MITVRTAATLCGVTPQTIRQWSKDHGIAVIRKGKVHAEYDIDEVALWLFEADQAEELAAYRRGAVPSDRVARIRSAVGTSFADGADDMTKAHPFLIQHEQRMIPATLRRAIFVEAERKGTDPITVLLDTFAASIADREASK